MFTGNAMFDADLRVKLNLDGETPEDQIGVRGIEQKRAIEYVIEQCGNKVE